MRVLTDTYLVLHTTSPELLTGSIGTWWLVLSSTTFVLDVVEQ